ncbi:MAG: GAF domain-containing sensor histidine kinase [Anaerolineae bacterium]
MTPAVRHAIIFLVFGGRQANGSGERGLLDNVWFYSPLCLTALVARRGSGVVIVVHVPQAQNGDRPQVGKVSQGKEARIGPKHRLRLSMRARFTLAVLLALVPIITVAHGIAWNTPYFAIVCFSSVFSLGLGLALIHWAYSSLFDLAEKARSLAGLDRGSRSFLGLIRTDQPGDEALSRALDRIEQSFNVLRALNDISRLLVCEEDLGCVLKAIVDKAVILLKADAGIIGLWDPEREVFQDVAATNLPIMFPGRCFKAGESLTSQVAKSGRMILVEDYTSYPFRIPELEPLGLRAALGVPLMVGDQSRGALMVSTLDPKRRFTPQDGELLATFASQAGAAFEKARLYQLALDQLRELKEAREELERTLSSLVRVQEEERSRIAADVHDGVVQMMVGSLYELQAAMALSPGEFEIRAKLEKCGAMIRDSIAELRRVIYNLRPAILDAAGLAPAVERLLEDLVSSVHVTYSVIGTPIRLPASVEIGAYRIVQEALHNAMRHSEADTVSLCLRFADDILSLTVHDNGKGFLVEKALSNCGRTSGLVGMKERARSLKGKLLIHSVVGQGTTVTALIPYRVGRSLSEHPRFELYPGLEPKDLIVVEKEFR